jgi:hypothetical protein
MTDSDTIDDPLQQFIDEQFGDMERPQKITIDPDCPLCAEMKRNDEERRLAKRRKKQAEQFLGNGDDISFFRFSE